MALRKAMILVGALLLVSTLQKRIQQVNELTPHEPEEMIKHAGDRTMKKTMEQMVEQEEELAAALVEEDVYKGVIGIAGKDAEEEAEPMAGAEPRAELVVKDEQAAASSEDMKRTLKLIQRSKDKGKGKGKDKGQNVGKDQDNKLVKGNFNVKIMHKFGELPERVFRYPVLNGRWWIIRLAFMRGEFTGFVYQEVPATKTLLIKSWKAQEEFDDEAIIPLWGNYIGAKVGDKITFDVGSMAQEGEGKPRPMATNVIIREREHAVGTGLILAPPPSDVRTQVLYYISDENLRTDKFFQDIIAATEGGWISTDFLLLCRRLKQLGASTKSIIEGLRDAPGVEVRDMPGQEAIRRTSPPPPLETGTVARKDVIFPLLEDHWADKKKYTLEMMKSIGGLPVEKTMEKMLGQDQEDIAKLAGPEGDEQERAPAVAEAEGPESQEEQKDWPTRARQAAKKLAVKRKADGDARHAKDKARAESKKEEKARERAKRAAVDKAAAKKAAAEKPAAKKALAEVGQAAAENSAAEKAAAFAKRRQLEQAAADEAATEQAAVEKAAEEAAAAPGASSDNQKSWGSWFSMLPRSAWGYLGLPLTTGNPSDQEKKAGEQNADDAREQQQEKQTSQEPITK